MFEYILQYISQLDTTYLYFALLFFAFIENVFPPSPSDMVIIVGSSLIATTGVEFIPILIGTSIFSALGFILMYYIGHFFGDSILRSGKIKFIDNKDLERTDEWFKRFGFYLIMANRFLPGTRSVISFFAGAHRLSVGYTFLAASISAFFWNFIIIYIGYIFGHNIKSIDRFFNTYSTIVISITVVVLAYVLYRVYLIRKKSKLD